MSPLKSVTKPTQNKEYEFHPSQLSDSDRAKYVVEALLEYNKGIIKDNPIGASQKFNKLRSTAFVFMRGTADLMYRDFYGTDADKSMVLCMGDVHLENYGVMETDNGSLVWGLNDFDEANFAPFTWDLKRGATSIILAALDSKDKKPINNKRARKMAYAFAEAYLTTIKQGIDRNKYPFEFHRGDSPQEIMDLFKEASKIKEDEFLQKKYLDLNSPIPKFKNTNEIQRIVTNEDELIYQFQEALDKYLASLHTINKELPKKIKVWDLATKTGSGTGSIGLWRYYALVELINKKGSKNIILEIKQERKSVLDPYVGGGLLKFNSEGSRVAYAENVQLHNANPFYGYTTIGGLSYLVRKRSPYKRRVALGKLKKIKQFSNYIEACGKALAFAHLQSDKILMEVYQNIAASILHSVNPETFSIDISGFASKMADQVKQDWIHYKQTYDKGIFNFA